MSIALKYIPHYTYEDYCQWEGRWELIDGMPYSMTPAPSLKHQSINVKIVHQLSDALKGCSKCKVFMPIDWKINEDTVVQPDASIVCGTSKSKAYLDFPPSLIFEILSPSTERKDKTMKYELYESQGVKYYVIVKPDSEIAEVYELKNKVYQKAKETTKGKFEFTINDCNMLFSFSKIWK